MAAAYARLHPQTIKNWFAEGEIQSKRRDAGEDLSPEQTALANFFAAVTAARLEAGVRWQQVVDNAAARDPAWALRMLQYRFPNDYREPPRFISAEAGEETTLRVVIQYADEGNHTPPASSGSTADHR